VRLSIGAIFVFRQPGARLPAVCDLLVEIAPLFLGPPKLLDCRREVEEMDRDYRSAGTQVGISDEGVELATSLDQSLVDLCEPFTVLARVGGPMGAQASLLGLWPEGRRGNRAKCCCDT
jgi:hypothetical protein